MKEHRGADEDDWCLWFWGLVGLFVGVEEFVGLVRLGLES